MEFIRLVNQANYRFLIVVPTEKLRDNNWKDEFNKWNQTELYNNNVETMCYASINKVDSQVYDVVIFDECFRGDTEILTNQGYKQFQELDGNELVAQWDNGKISFVKPIRHVKKSYKGQLIDWKIRGGRTIESHVFLTPNHQQIFNFKNNNVWNKKEICNIPFNHNYNIPIAGKSIDQNNDKLSILERLYVAIQADGSLHYTKENELTYSISLSKQRKIERMEWLLSQYDSKLWNEVKAKKGYKRWLINVPVGDAKKLSTHFKIEMGFDRARDFIEELIQWDGYQNIDNYDYYYSSSVKENVDFIAGVAPQGCFSAFQSFQEDNRKETFSTIYRVQMYKDKDVKNMQLMTKSLVEYEGDVYCVEVPSGAIVVRSQGYTFISGNCHNITPLNAGFFKQNRCRSRVALTATYPRDSEKQKLISERFGSVIYEVTLDEAVEWGLVAPYQINVVLTQLDSVTKSVAAGSKQKPFYTTERANYDYLSGQISGIEQKYLDMGIMYQTYWEASDISRIKMLRLQRMKQFASSYTKGNVANYLLNKVVPQDDRTLVFCGSIEQAKSLSAYSFHSQGNDKAFNLFMNQEINRLACVNKLNEGINLPTVDSAIITQLNSNELDLIQRIGRIIRFREGHVGVIWIIVAVNTVDYEWFRKASLNLNPDNITYIEFNELREKYG